jgi:hypothetical protein
MKSFARVDVLDAITRQVVRDDGHDWRRALSDTVFVCTQHLLETTGSLVESLLDLGARGDLIFVLGKCYSTCPSVLDRLGRIVAYAHGGTTPEAPGGYQRAFLADVDRLCRAASAEVGRKGRRVVVLDDGGLSIERIGQILDANGSPKRVVGIEQTTFGVGRLGPLDRTRRFLDADPPPPVILVAQSAAKTVLEPPMIAEAILARSPASLDFRLRCGIIGLGNIGCSLARNLLIERHEVAGQIERRAVAGHDIKRQQARLLEAGMHWSGGLADLIERSDVVFGCTGKDVFEGNLSALDGAYGVKIFASCSSGDREFRSLIRHIHDASGVAAGPFAPLDHVFPNRQTPAGRGHDSFFPHGSLEVIVARGGFPVNFDGSPESVPSRDIQLTRGLLLGAILQAVCRDTARDSSSTVTRMLDPEIQRFVVARWQESRRLSPEDSGRFPDLDRFEDTAWIREISRGLHVPCKAISNLFRGDRHARP